MADDWTRIIVLDTETTGKTSPSKNQILTIDALHATKFTDENGVTQFKRDGDLFHGEVARQPWARIEQEALQVTGIDIDLWKGESEAEVLGKLVSWIVKNAGGGYKILCGYNVVFDKRFLHFMFERNPQFKWTNAFSYYQLDVMQLAMWAVEFGYIEKPANMRLETVARYLGVWKEGAHDSSVDVDMTLGVLNELNRRIANAKETTS